MSDAMIDLPVSVEEAPQLHPLERTHRHAMEAMALTLEWQSEQARHSDMRVAGNLSLCARHLPP
jgi:hypothetical protein